MLTITLLLAGLYLDSWDDDRLGFLVGLGGYFIVDVVLGIKIWHTISTT